MPSTHGLYLYVGHLFRFPLPVYLVIKDGGTSCLKFIIGSVQIDFLVFPVIESGAIARLWMNRRAGRLVLSSASISQSPH